MLFHEMRHGIFSTSVLLIRLGLAIGLGLRLRLGLGLGLGLGFGIHPSRVVMGFKLITLMLIYRRSIFTCS